MASHHSTPASVLNAPTRTVRHLSVSSPPNRAMRREQARKVGFFGAPRTQVRVDGERVTVARRPSFPELVAAVNEPYRKPVDAKLTIVARDRASAVFRRIAARRRVVASLVGGPNHGREIKVLDPTKFPIVNTASPHPTRGRVEVRDLPRTLLDRVLRRTRRESTVTPGEWCYRQERYELAACGDYHWTPAPDMPGLPTPGGVR